MNTELKFIQFPQPRDSREGVVCYTDTINASLVYSAYLQGIFPWYDEGRGEPVLWWCPDPRFVLPVEDLHVPERLERFIRHTPYTYTMDKDFAAVIRGCSEMKREGQNGTWIGQHMIDVYCELAERGIAHSVEVWHGSTLAGGLYGVTAGSVFFGESMFTVENDSAKSAFVIFARTFASCGGRLIDSQVYTDNLARFGAHNISRDAFLRLEKEYLPVPLSGDLKTSFEAASDVFRQGK